MCCKRASFQHHAGRNARPVLRLQELALRAQEMGEWADREAQTAR